LVGTVSDSQSISLHLGKRATYGFATMLVHVFTQTFRFLFFGLFKFGCNIYIGYVGFFVGIFYGLAFTAFEASALRYMIDCPAEFVSV
jgi:hypothetical protein